MSYILKYRPPEVDTKIFKRIEELKNQLEMVFASDANTTDSVTMEAYLDKTLRARTERGRYLGEGLFSDPAWDMLLYLMSSKLKNRPVSITDLCSASNVPATTGLRWVRVIEQAGLIARRDDPCDKRRTYVELTTTACSGMENYLVKWM